VRTRTTLGTFYLLYDEQKQRQLNNNEALPIKMVRIGRPQFRELDQSPWRSSAEGASAQRVAGRVISGIFLGIPFYVDGQWDGFEIEFVDDGDWRRRRVAQISAATGVSARAF
jgi:hypothetical protein